MLGCTAKKSCDLTKKRSTKTLKHKDEKQMNVEFQDLFYLLTTDITTEKYLSLDDDDVEMN